MPNDILPRKPHHNSLKTHCKNGHEFTPENTYVNNGNRTCRSCCKKRQQSEKYKNRIAATNKAYYVKNREQRLKYANERYLKLTGGDKKVYIARSNKYRSNHPEYDKQKAKRYRENNPDKIKSYSRSALRLSRARAWRANKTATDVQFNIKSRIRNRIGIALKNCFNGSSKKEKTIELLGCSYEFLKKYIEERFIDGMDWGKCFSGEIHFDHIRPCASFDLTDPEKRKQCFNYKNLQPLWAVDNLKKGSKII